MSRAVFNPIMRSPLRSVFGGGVGGGGVPKPIDLFVIVGQSNAEGRGDSAQSPASPHGRFWNGSSLVALADPVGGASTGSMWPAFANEWYAATGGRLAAFVEAAAGGTGLLPGAGGQWSPSGTLRGAAVSAANAAIAAIASSPESLSPGNVYFVWCQGEQEASTINGTTVTADLYEQALKDLAAYFKAQIPQMVGFHVVSTGGSGVAGPLIDTTQANFAAIRRAQSLAAASDANIEIAYSGALGFQTFGLMKDGLHYSQAGLNLAGGIAARTVAGAGEPILAPTQLAATGYPYTTDANASARTIAHAFNPASRAVMVFVHGPRTSSYPALTVTCGGVPMSSVAYSRADNVGRNHMQVFVLNSPTGFSGDIVVSSSSALFSIHCAVVEFSEQVWVTGIGGNLAATAAASQSHSTFSAGPAQLYSVIATASTELASVSFSGATEIHEATIFRAATGKHYAMALASSSVAANSTTAVSTTHGSTCDTLNAVSVAVRRKLSRE